MTETYEAKDGRLLARVVRNWQSGGGTQFVSAPEDILQLGVLRFPTDHEVPAHVHNPVERTTVGTMEVLLVVTGVAEVVLENNYVLLGPGDAIALMPGTRHSLRVLHEATILECKNGPFYGTDVDKKRT